MFVRVQQYPSVDEGAGVTAFATANSVVPGEGGVLPRLSGLSIRVNGLAALPRVVEGEYLTPLETPVPGAGPGAQIVVEAENASGRVVLRFRCPAALDLVAPVDGAHVSAGRAVTASWGRRVSFENGGGAAVDLYPYDAARNRIAFCGGSLDAYAQISEGATSAMVVPQATTEPGYVLNLLVAGAFVRDRGSDADCQVVRRARLVRD